MVDGFVAMMNSEHGLTAPVNMGNPVEFTIRELAELVIELTNSSSTLINKPLPADDPQQRQPDIKLAKAELDWEPITPLKDGLLKTINYFDQMISDGLA